MGEWKNIIKDNISYFLTTTAYDYIPIFEDDKIKEILLDNLNYYTNKYQYKLISYVIMPEHIHFIIYDNKEVEPNKFMRDYKKYTSYKIIEKLKSDKNDDLLYRLKKEDDHYNIWMRGYRNFPIYNENIMKQKIEYIHKNPVKRGLVNNIKDYKYSSFNWYY